MSIRIRPMKNGNYRFNASVELLGSPGDWSGIKRDITKPFIDNWRNYFASYNITLTVKGNGAVQLIEKFPNELVVILRTNGFSLKSQRIIADRDIIEYKKTGHNINEFEKLLYLIFKTNVEASEIIDTSDLLN